MGLVARRWPVRHRHEHGDGLQSTVSESPPGSQGKPRSEQLTYPDTSWKPKTFCALCHTGTTQRSPSTGRCVSSLTNSVYMNTPWRNAAVYLAETASTTELGPRQPPREFHGNKTSLASSWNKSGWCVSLTVWVHWLWCHDTVSKHSITRFDKENCPQGGFSPCCVWVCGRRHAEIWN